MRLLLAAVVAISAGMIPAATAKAQGVQFDPTIITYAGNGSLTANNSGNGGQATAAGLNNPEGIAYDTHGNTYIADYGNNTIRVVSATGMISAFAGTGAACPNPTAATGACGDGGAASAATFTNPSAMQFDSQGNLFIADFSDYRIRKITATNGVITPASIISTVAGTGVAGSTGNTGLATAAELYNPHGLRLDAAGDLWIANQGQGVSCTVGYVPATAQTITIGGVATNVVAGHYYVVAGEIGTCGGGVTGAGTQGTNVQLNAPTNVALDSAGNLYIGDYNNGKVRKLVTTTGVITTVAGTTFGACPVTAPNAAAPNPVPNCGDGGAAAQATLNGPTGVYVDNANNVIIGDAFGARVREVNGSTGIISTISGDSQQCTNITQTVTNAAYPACGDGGAATKALVSFPIIVSVNPAGNILYVDQYDNKIREIVEHIVFPATNVGSTSPSQNVNLITTGTGNTIITSITVPSDAAGNPEFIVGTVTGCVVGGTTGNAPGSVCTIPVTFNPAYPGPQTQPLVVVTNGGTFQFGLTGTGVAPQAVLLPGELSTVAGTGIAGTTGNGGAATAATLTAPRDLNFDTEGNLYIGDLASNEIRKVTPVGVISDFAGGGTTNYVTAPGGPATAAALSFPTGAVFDSAGNAYIPDFNHHVVARVDAVTNAITVYAGNGTAGYTGDGGAATAAELSGPAALAIDPTTGDLYIADPGTGATSNQTIRLVTAASGIITTVAGNGTICASPTAACGDGGPGTAAQLNQPNGLVLDSNDNLYISDSFDNRIRLLTKGTGIITTVAGTGAAGYTGDGAAATAATLNDPFQIQLDAAGDLYIADVGNNAIRFVSAATGKISTVAGSVNGTACTTVPSPSCGDGGAANVSAFSAPTGIALDAGGDLFVADSGTNRVRKVTVNPTLLAFPPAPAIGVTEGPLTAMLTNIGNATLTYTTPTTGSNALVTTTSNPASPVTSNAFAQTNATTCGPISSTSPVTTLLAGATCNYVVTFTPDTAVGNYVGTLVETDNSLYSGTGNALYPSPLTQTVNLTGSAVKGAATVALSSNPNPSYVGQPVTFTATLSGGGVAPTGTVTFTYTVTGSTTPVQINTPATVSTTAGVTTATVTTSSLPLGTDTVTATYSGDSNYVGPTASPTVGQAVIQVASTNQAVSAASASISYGTADQLTYSIPVVTGAGVPVGSVAFTAGTTALGSATWPATPVTGGCPTGGGTCYLLTDSAAPTNIPEGSPTTVTGTFTATSASGYASGAPSTPVTVGQVPGTNDAVTAASATITVGTGDALTYSIPVVTGAPVPAGSVAFTSGTTSLGSATWPASPATGTCPGGTGTCYLLTTNPAPVNIPLSSGANTPITGAFTATAASGYASASPTTSVVVGAAGGSGDTVTVANNPTTFGTADTLTFTIPVSSGAPAPVGTVTFTSGGTTLGTATWPANPTASGGNYTLSISPTNLPVSPTGSTTPVTATFVPGAGSGYGSAAPMNTVVVNKVPVSPGDGISANPSATTSGTTVTLTFTVANVNNTPATGTVTFTVGGITYGAANLTGTTANGVTTYTTTTTALPVGPDTVTGTYSGDGNYAGGALQTNVAISSNNTTDTVAVTTNPTVVESADTITFSIPVVTGSAAPTGTVVFTSGTTALGTATFPAGATATGGFYTVSISTTALPLTVAPSTSTPVLATYTAGTGSGYASAAPVTSVVVNQVPSTGDAVAVTNNPTAVGSPDPITFSIPVVAGAPVPAGTVTFTSGTTALGTATWPANPTIANGAYTISIDPSNLPLSVTPGSTPVAASFAATPASGYASGTANTTVVVSPVTSTDTLAAANNPTTFGTADPLTFSIPVSSGAPAPVGTVTFTSGGTALGTATWPANPTPVNGNYTISVSPTNIPVSTAATTPLSATFTAGAGSGYGSGTATSTVVVNKVPVSPGDGISANPTATTSGTTVTLTFTVTNVNNTPATGTVTFTVGGITYGTANLTGTTANGVTTYTTTTTALPVGPDTVTGTYSGDGNYAGGALQTNVAISANNTADTVKVTTSPTVVESADTITFSIPVVTGSAAPTGTVVFTSGTTALGTATFPAGATATGGFYTVSISTTALPLTVAPSTSTPVLATYTAGTGSGYASAAPVTSVVVNQVPSTGDTLTAQNATTIVGTADQLTFSIPAVAGAPVPAGTVTFTSGTTTLGTATWPSTPTATGGFYTISIDPTTLPLTVAPATSTPATATFAATAASGYASGTASANVLVNPVGGTGAALAVANNPTVVGAADTLTFSIPVNSGAPAPAGTVVFTSGTTNLGTATWPANVTPANGFYTISVSPTNIPLSAAGSTTPLTATFTASPGSGYGSSTPTANVTVTQIPGTGDTLTSTPNPSIYGQTVTFTETIPTVNGLTPSGTVTFAYNGTPIGTGTVTNGVATITTSTLPPGSDPVTASYGGNTNYAPVSNMVTQVVNPATPAGTLTPSTTTPACGTSVTLTESLTAITVPVAGTVQFYDNGVAIGTPVTVGANGSASYTTSTLPCGTADKITAIFTPSAGSPYTTVTTGPATVNVGAADFSIAATPASQTVNPGDTTVYNVSLSGVTVPFTSSVTLTATGLPPGATVTFANPTYVPGQGPTSTTMTIVTSPTQALLRTEQNGNQIFYGLLLLPLLGLRRVRRKLRALPKGITYGLAALLLLGGLGAMTGCGGGYFGPQPQTFTITVTGTSGTLSHSTTVTLTVR